MRPQKKYKVSVREEESPLWVIVNACFGLVGDKKRDFPEYQDEFYLGLMEDLAQMHRRRAASRTTASPVVLPAPSPTPSQGQSPALSPGAGPPSGQFNASNWPEL